MGKYTEAEEEINLLNRAQYRITADRKIRFRIQCLPRLGHIFQMGNKYPEAREMLGKAKVGFDKIGSQLGAAQSLKSLGNICQMENKYSEAREMLGGAKVEFEKIGSQLGAAQCLQSLGVICQMENKCLEGQKLDLK